MVPATALTYKIIGDRDLKLATMSNQSTTAGHVMTNRPYNERTLPKDSCLKSISLLRAVRNNLLPLGILLAEHTLAHSVELKSPSISLLSCSFVQNFVEDFHDFKVAAWKSSGGWIAHTPWAGDFGDAAFSDPTQDFPFTVVNGSLRIEARRDQAGKWHSGLLSSVDTMNMGFSQKYGYFELKAKLPAGDGLWPAFWLVTNKPKTLKEPGIEIDIMEHYGRRPGEFHSVIHIWNEPPMPNKGSSHVTQVRPGLLYEDFHLFGADVESDFITFFFDRQVVWRVETPVEHKKPLMVLLNLALGSGWPINRAPNHSIMEVARVSVFTKENSQCQSTEKINKN